MPSSAADFIPRVTEALASQRAEEAETLGRQALQVDPDNDVAKALVAEALLMQGRWEEGWPFHEFRPARSTLGGRLMNLPYPEWRGEPLSGKRILVWGEQGIGDEIQFCRFVPKLRELGASAIMLACQAVNMRAFTHLKCDAVVNHTRDRVELPTNLDYWVLLGSLPYLLDATQKSISGAPYLGSCPATRSGVGLVERGNPLHPNDSNRSLPVGSLQQIVPLGRILAPQGDTLDSLAQLAALELLITVDTSWAHMAGAIGLPCWLLLPFRGLDWRWMRDTLSTPWYDSLRLYRQLEKADWGQVLDEVSADLRHV